MSNFYWKTRCESAMAEAERLRASVEQLRAERDAAVRAGLEAAAKTAEVFMHHVPDEGGDELDRIGRYSNGTVERITAAIRALKPPVDAKAGEANRPWDYSDGDGVLAAAKPTARCVTCGGVGTQLRAAVGINVCPDCGGTGAAT